MPPVTEPIATGLFGSYGPIAFGVAVLLVIWQVIVRPLLTAARADLPILQAISSQLKETAEINRDTAKLHARIAVVQSYRPPEEPGNGSPNR